MKKQMGRNNVLFYGDLDKETKKHNYMNMVIILLIAAVVFMLIDNYYTKQAIEQCVANGNDYDYCLVELS